MRPDAAARTDAHLIEKVEAEGFCGSVLVARNGEVVLRRGYGLADRESGTANTPTSRHRIHWVTMSFTAMAVLMLEADGALLVEDQICQYIADCPAYWQETV